MDIVNRDTFGEFMKTVHILSIASLIAVAAILVASYAVSENDDSIRIDQVMDEDGKIGGFRILDKDGMESQIRPGLKICENTEIRYVGDLTGWSENVEIQFGSGLVIFTIYEGSNPINYVFRFYDIDFKDLSACIKDDKPVVEFKAKNSIDIELLYYDSKGLDDIKEYKFQTYEYMASGNVTLPTYFGYTMFSDSATARNADLMAFALGLELSTGVDAKDRSVSVVKLLKDIGCANATTNKAYSEPPTIYTTDVAIGSNSWNGYTVIFLALNGTKYTTEFAANAMLGESGDHKGFTLAKDQALSMLREFISSNGITGKTKILITGYSRTAAGANLTAAYLSDAIAEGKVRERVGDIELTKEDVYGFSFETPLCGYYEEDNGRIAPTDSRYDNIWYAINSDDPVTYVPTKNYGFVRYGQQFAVQSHDTAKYGKMIEMVAKYYGEEVAKYYDMTKFNIIADVKNPSEIWEGFFDKFFGKLGTREFYYKNMETDFVNLIYVVFAKDNMLTDIVNKSGGAMSLVTALYQHSGDKAGFMEHFKPIITEAAQANGCEEYSESILNSFYEVAELVKRYCNDSLMNLITDKYLLSMIANYKMILISHLPGMTYGYVVQESSLY